MVHRNSLAKSEQKALKKSDFTSANVSETLPLKPVKRCVARSGAGRRGWLACIRLFINQPLPGEVPWSRVITTESGSISLRAGFHCPSSQEHVG